MTKKAATKMDGASAIGPPVPPPEAEEEAAQAEVVKQAGHIDVMDPAVRNRAEENAAGAQKEGRRRRDGARPNDSERKVETP